MVRVKAQATDLLRDELARCERLALGIAARFEGLGHSPEASGRTMHEARLRARDEGRSFEVEAWMLAGALAELRVPRQEVRRVASGAERWNVASDGAYSPNDGERVREHATSREGS